MNERIPTVDDLRVKLCYICREEERFDAEPEIPPKAWTHPCKCTLIAHETCLLKWIQTSQGSTSRAPNALKCPQCGSEYELESNNPLILRALATGNKVLQKVGRMFTLFGAASIVVVVGSGFYILCTAYGAWAIHQFLGTEMYDLLLTSDPSNWPWPAYLNLPLLPISLILSRFQSSTSSILPIVPILLVWPPSTPVGAPSRALTDYWAIPANARKLALAPPSTSGTWPPSPFACGLFLVPFVRIFYRKYFTRFSHWVLGAPQAPDPPAGGWGWQINDGRGLMIRIRANVRDDAPPDQQQQQPQQLQAQREREPQDGPNVEPAVDANAEAVAAAEQLIEINTSSIGRLIGGALLIPSIASRMGALLLRLSLALPSPILREFLGVKPRWFGGRGAPPPPPLGLYSYDKGWDGLGPAGQFGVALRLVMGAAWGGTRTWAESDPVWWRNTLGLGVFVVAKDCLHLLHLWLAKRELETRKVKSKDFKGVDMRSLDLISGFPAV